MSREVGVSKAKAQLSRLLDDVERGETVIVTRRGRAIARIVPEPHRRQQKVDKAIDEIAQFGRQNKKITVDEILSLIREGRKY